MKEYNNITAEQISKAVLALYDAGLEKDEVAAALSFIPDIQKYL